ncbi:MAG: toxin glutamine deamidase domain-containing protein [Acidimicrobiales bacterium]
MGRQPEAADRPEDPPATRARLTRAERGPEPRIGVDRPSTAVEQPPPMEIVDEDSPGLYDRTACRPPEGTDSHQPPKEWIVDRNPGYPDAGRMTNCGDCTRASELTWRGIDTQAGAHTDPPSGGEPLVVMDRWSPGERVVTSYDGIKDRLEALGPGSSALVAAYWKRGGGHWFNAFNDNGVVVAADGQSARSEPWPPTPAGLGIRPERIEKLEAIVVDQSGRHLHDDDWEQVP